MGPARFHCATLLSLTVSCSKADTTLNHDKKLCPKQKQLFVSCEIRTHAHRSGLRPERSALDHSAKLTLYNFSKSNQL